MKTASQSDRKQAREAQTAAKLAAHRLRAERERARRAAELAEAETRGCTARTPRCRDARDYTHELAPCCRAHVRNLMVVVADILNESGATWWADYGTLLGAVRNPMTTWADYPWLRQDGRTTAGPAAGIIPHDKDADLGILWRDFEGVRRRLRMLPSRGFNVHVNMHRASIKVRVSARNHTNVDLFFWRGRDDVLYREKYAQVDKFKGKEFPKAMIAKPSTVIWEGVKLPAPTDPAAFLQLRYGPNWRTPVAANNDGVLRP